MCYSGCQYENRAGGCRKPHFEVCPLEEYERELEEEEEEETTTRRINMSAKEESFDCFICKKDVRNQNFTRHGKGLKLCAKCNADFKKWAESDDAVVQFRKHLALTTDIKRSAND